MDDKKTVLIKQMKTFIKKNNIYINIKLSTNISILNKIAEYDEY